MQQRLTDQFGFFEESNAILFRELAAGFRITASLVCDSTGNTVSSLGSSKGLGNETDLSLLVALRRQAQVVLTSGLTFRADEYRFPMRADLAVLTTKPIEMAVPTGQRLLVLSSGYKEAVAQLQAEGYSRIHIEYGVTGIKEIVTGGVLDALFLSSRSAEGIAALAESLNLTPTLIELADLYVGLVAWQQPSTS